MQKRLGWRFNQRHSIPDWIEHRMDGLRYARRVLVTRPQNLIGYWPMWEGNGVVSYDNSPQGNDGAYTGVTLAQPGIGDGRYSTFFDGINDFNNIFSAGLATDFNGAELTFLLWNRWTAAVLTDGIARVLTEIEVNGANFVRFQKDAANNQFSLRRDGGGVLEVTTFISAATTFQAFAMTVSETAGEVRNYLNGVQQGAVHTPIGAWAGALAIAVIGALNLVPNNVVEGWLTHGALWNVALTQPEIAFLSTLG